MRQNKSMFRAYAVAGAVAIVLYAVMPTSLLYDSIGLSCVIAILVGIRTSKPVKKLPWYLMAMGQAAWVVGDVLYDHLPYRSPSAADLAYLAAYPLLGAGLVLMIRSRRRGRDVPGLIDSAILTIGLGLLSWVFVADPIIDASTTPLIEHAVEAAYPLGDIILLAFVIRLVTDPGVRSPAFRLMISAMSLIVIADTLYAANPSPHYARVLDLFWLASYILWGLAALHPTMARLSTPSHLRATAFTTRRLTALAGAMLIAPILLATTLPRGIHIDTWLSFVGPIALSLLVMWRMAYNIEEIRTTARQRDRLRADLLHEASHDSLTGTANSPYVLQLIGGALRRGQRNGTSVGLLVIDMDGFDGINNQYGHGVGDEVLRSVAHRVQSSISDTDAVGRLASDQFVVLIDPMASEHDTTDLATQLLAAISEPVNVSGRTVMVTACIGAATSMDGGTDAQAFLHEANVATRRAKSAGRGRLEVFDNRLRSELSERGRLALELRTALETGKLEIDFQPVLAVPTAVVDGYEAKLRWNRPGRELMDPAAFLSVVATSDLICEIDRWVLKGATARLAALTVADPARFANLSVSVPISARLLASPGLLRDVDHALTEAGLPPHRLSVGITEMALVDVPDAALPLSAIRHAGVLVTIDDFGTGRTSISQIRHLPADALKVHQSLIDSDEPGARDLLNLLVNAAHACGLLVVAENPGHLGQLVDLRVVEQDSTQDTDGDSWEPASHPAALLRIVRDE